MTKTIKLAAVTNLLSVMKQAAGVKWYVVTTRKPGVNLMGGY